MRLRPGALVGVDDDDGGARSGQDGVDQSEHAVVGEPNLVDVIVAAAGRQRHLDVAAAAVRIQHEWRMRHQKMGKDVFARRVGRQGPQPLELVARTLALVGARVAVGHVQPAQDCPGGRLRQHQPRELRHRPVLDGLGSGKLCRRSPPAAGQDRPVAGITEEAGGPVLADRAVDGYPVGLAGLHCPGEPVELRAVKRRRHGMGCPLVVGKPALADLEPASRQLAQEGAIVELIAVAKRLRAGVAVEQDVPHVRRLAVGPAREFWKIRFLVGPQALQLPIGMKGCRCHRQARRNEDQVHFSVNDACLRLVRHLAREENPDGAQRKEEPKLRQGARAGNPAQWRRVEQPDGENARRQPGAAPSHPSGCAGARSRPVRGRKPRRWSAGRGPVPAA